MPLMLPLMLLLMLIADADADADVDAADDDEAGEQSWWQHAATTSIPKHIVGDIHSAKLRGQEHGAKAPAP